MFVTGSRGLVAELAQDVVGASAELAGDREAGAVVIDPPRNLTVVLVVGSARRAGSSSGDRLRAFSSTQPVRSAGLARAAPRARALTRPAVGSAT